MHSLERVKLPLAILLGCALMAGLMVALRDEPFARVEADLRPWVKVQRVVPQAVQLHVEAQGTVEARTEIELVAEVSGRIVETSEALEAGGFFQRGDTLIRIDPREYRAAVVAAEAALERNESDLELRREALERAQSLFEQGVASDSVLDDARAAFRMADAARRASDASLTQARLDLERTVLGAPFDGRARERKVGVGQFVTPGARLATIYAVDYAEVRLPLSEDELAYLDLPLAYTSADGAAPPPQVTLSAQIAGRRWSWPARVVRTEGALDPQTRMVVAVARVEDPYGRHREGDGEFMPLAVGMFVRAEIAGRKLEDVFVIPSRAHRPDRGLLVVDDQDRLRFRQVQVLRREAGRVIVSDGLVAGERVAVTPVEAPIDGMAVRVGESAPEPDAGHGRAEREAGGAVGEG